MDTTSAYFEGYLHLLLEYLSTQEAFEYNLGRKYNLGIIKQVYWCILISMIMDDGADKA